MCVPGVDSLPQPIEVRWYEHEVPQPTTEPAGRFADDELGGLRLERFVGGAWFTVDYDIQLPVPRS